LHSARSVTLEALLVLIFNSVTAIHTLLLCSTVKTYCCAAEHYPTCSPKRMSDVNTPRTVRVEHSCRPFRWLYGDGCVLLLPPPLELLPAAATAAAKSTDSSSQQAGGSFSVNCTHPAFFCAIQRKRKTPELQHCRPSGAAGQIQNTAIVAAGSVMSHTN
jgi:hypothetical protein